MVLLIILTFPSLNKAGGCKDSCVCQGRQMGKEDKEKGAAAFSFTATELLSDESCDIRLYSV